MLAESKKLKRQIKQLEKIIDKMPVGDLQVAKNGKYLKWYIGYGKERMYLPKSDYELARNLARKKYYKLKLNNLLREKRAIDYYLRHHDKDALDREIKFVNSFEYKDLLGKIYYSQKDELTRWMNEPYKKNTSHPEDLIHDTIAGYNVRSKSEALIVSYLTKYQIPHRYDCLLNIGDVYVFPDFTIRHPKTGEIIYWEHFGMVDKPEYLETFIRKIRNYISVGILPGKNLIITTETEKNPLSYGQVERAIRQFLSY